MWYDKKDKPDDFELASCPVCKTTFGRRNLSIVYKAHCYECRASYTWYPLKDKPKAVLDKDEERRRCGCLSCEAKNH